MRRIRAFIQVMGLNWLTMIGAVLVTVSVLIEIVLIGHDLFSESANPYVGIVTYMIMPAPLMLGLVMIPVGVWWRLRRDGLKLNMASLAELNARGVVRQPGRVMQMIGLLTMANLLIFALLSYEGYHYMESTSFCGQVCHEVMHPEFTTYQRSPHSEVECVQCHIGPGASWFVQSKISGARQVLAVTFDTYHRPIKTPIENLRPAREVCEVCHRPAKFHGNLIRVIDHYTPDKDNTHTRTVLNMRVGTGGEHGIEAEGIHWHVSENAKIRYYATDPKRENIVWVELENEDGTRRVWRRPDSKIQEHDIPEKHIREMDCIDCHNRPTHIYLPPGEAIDEKLKNGQLDQSIPWIRKVAEQVLTREYDTNAQADRGIERGTLKIYQEEHPEVWTSHADAIRDAVPVLKEIFHQFVFPEMKIKWNTYPSLIGHPTKQTARCFRCHDGLMRDEKARVISTDCESCHYVLAHKALDPGVLGVIQGEAVRFQRWGNDLRLTDPQKWIYRPQPSDG